MGRKQQARKVPRQKVPPPMTLEEVAEVGAGRDPSPGNSRSDALVALGRIRREVVQLDAQLGREVARARRLGASWRDVGNALDVTPQAAQQRYGKSGSMPAEPVPRRGSPGGS